MDLWEVFAKSSKKEHIQEKKAVVIEGMLPVIAPRMQKDEIMALFDEIRKDNVIGMVSDFMKSKQNSLETYKKLKQKNELKLNWDELNKNAQKL